MPPIIEIHWASAHVHDGYIIEPNSMFYWILVMEEFKIETFIVHMCKCPIELELKVGDKSLT